MVRARRREPAPTRQDAPEVPSGPVRTCVGCRGRTAASELLRVVVAGGEVVVDGRRRLPGRGAWLHPDHDCLRLAQRRGAFTRALRTGRPLAATAVEAFVAEQTAREVPGPGKD